MRLVGRVCVVTGATGMAAAAARRIARDGGSVFVVALDAGEAADLAAEIDAGGTKAGSQGADLRDDAEAGAAFEACVERFGRIDGLFAVAGASARRFGDGPVHEASPAGLRAALDLNVVPALTAAHFATRTMLSQDPNREGGRGSIVMMSSVLTRHPSPLFVTHGYAAAKGAIESLTRSMAARYAGDRIRVNAIAPGLVATPMSARAQADPESVAYVAGKQPLADGLLPAEAAAELAVFLLSDESKFITGQVISVDGGWSVTEGPTER